MHLKYFLWGMIFALFVSPAVEAQNDQCVHCNMIIKDDLHRAKAVLSNGKTVHFGAIKCLMNYRKSKKETMFSALHVADYSNGEWIDAETATYLKSDKIKSPMGANLSAFKSEVVAHQFKKKKGGEIFDWETLKKKFQKQEFGVHMHNHHRPDAHAPIGVMGDHLHHKGGVMVSIRYMHMNMEGNKSGTSSIANATIYNSYMVAPQKMNMNMYMLGVMYAPSNKLTLMLMQHYIKNDMDLTAMMMMNGNTVFVDFSTASSGFGDLRAGGLYSLYNKHTTSLHLNGTINIPVGSIEQKDDTPMMQDAKLPYAMQLGSGTFDIILGATFKGNYEKTSWGVQPLFTFRTGENNQGYRFGNLHQINLWGAYMLTDWLSTSVRFLGTTQGKISGSDPALNPMMVTTADTNNYGGERLNSYLGLNIAFDESSTLKDFRIGVEAGLPMYENYKGIQMDEEITVNFGLKYTL